MPKVSVKWRSERFDDIEVDMSQEPLVLKSQLFALTEVLPERQKLLYKGKTIKDDDWNGITLTDGALLMMLGSVEAVPEVIRPTNAEGGDGASSNQYDDDGKEVVRMPIGLKNLGNTCYFNSTLQSFHAIPELVEGIRNWSTEGSAKARQEIKPFTGALYTLFNDLKTGNREFYMPLLQLGHLHQLYPRFAERGEGGVYQQQDANECFSELVRELSNVAEVDVQVGNEKKKTLVRQFIEGVYDVKMKNTEDPEEPVQESKETFMQLSCFIDTETRYLQIGIKNKLTEEIEKFSPKLGRDCKYQKETRISRLPAYLNIQMVRFEYKGGEKQLSAKILKDVKFPLILDIFECCTPELQAKLKPHREAHKAYEDKLMEKQRAEKLDAGAKELKKEEPTKFLPTSFEDDPGSCNTGVYQLNAVITHKGRSLNSGHYIAWVRVKGNKWACCDDDSTYPVSEEDVLKLSGGGDHHIGYVFIYGPRATPILED